MKSSLKQFIVLAIVIVFQGLVTTFVEGNASNVSTDALNSTFTSNNDTTTITPMQTEAGTTNVTYSSETTSMDTTDETTTSTQHLKKGETAATQAPDSEATTHATMDNSGTSTGNSDIFTSIRDSFCDIVWLLLIFSVLFFLCILVKCIQCLRRCYRRIKISHQDKHINQYQKWLAVYSPKGHNVVCTSADGLKTL